MVSFAEAACISSHKQPSSGRAGTEAVPEAAIKAVGGGVGDDSDARALKQPLLPESTAATSQPSPSKTVYQEFTLPQAVLSSQQVAYAAENRRHASHDIETCSCAAVHGGFHPGKVVVDRGVDKSNAGSAAHVCVHCGHGEPAQARRSLCTILAWSHCLMLSAAMHQRRPPILAAGGCMS